MIRALLAYALSLALTVTSFSLAHARGQNPDMGPDMGNAIQMVLCTGTGMTTITAGPDGTPIESVHLCPDGAQMFVANFSLPVMDAPVEQVVSHVATDHVVMQHGRIELSHSARGPPELV